MLVLILLLPACKQKAENFRLLCTGDYLIKNYYTANNQTAEAERVKRQTFEFIDKKAKGSIPCHIWTEALIECEEISTVSYDEHDFKVKYNRVTGVLNEYSLMKRGEYTSEQIFAGQCITVSNKKI
ncbi:hypothetical protein MCEZE4_02093 [Burkholderiaceae bacterium]